MTCAVVLAAGRSRRMGTQKLLLPFAGSTVIAHGVDHITAADVGRIVVVLGSDGPAIRTALAGRPVEFVENPAADSEMLDSLRCALRALSPSCRSVLVCLGDQPGITAALIEALVAAFRSREGTVVVPLHAGRRGHPVLFGVEHVERLLRSYDDVGLRGLLDDPAVDVLEVPWPTALADLDYPEDYRKALRLWEERRQKP